jgi:hypothetical protein
MSYLLKAHQRECEEVQGRCCLPLKDLPGRERSPNAKRQPPRPNPSKISSL